MEKYNLLIAFIGHTKKQTETYFKSFIDENIDDISVINDTSCVLQDGTKIQCIYKKSPDKKCVDQIIYTGKEDDAVKDKIGILDTYNLVLNWQIPEEFNYIFCLIDK